MHHSSDVDGFIKIVKYIYLMIKAEAPLVSLISEDLILVLSNWTRWFKGDHLVTPQDQGPQSEGINQISQIIGQIIANEFVA